MPWETPPGIIHKASHSHSSSQSAMLQGKANYSWVLLYLQEALCPVSPSIVT